MANFKATLTFLDGDGSETTRQYHVVAVDRAAAVAKIQGLAEAAQDLILGAVVGASITDVLDISTWGVNAAPAANSDKEIQAVFKGRVTGNYPYETSLPTFDKDTYAQPGGTIDLTNPTVFAFVQTALVLNGFTDYRYADIISITEGKERIG